jgi:hypothetical protein
VGAVDGMLRRRKDMGRGEDGEEERREGFMYGLRSAVKAIQCGSEMKTEKEMVFADMIYDGPRAVFILHV